jgi:hypothetical protein
VRPSQESGSQAPQTSGYSTSATLAQAAVSFGNMIDSNGSVCKYVMRCPGHRDSIFLPYMKNMCRKLVTGKVTDAARREKKQISEAAFFPPFVSA